MESRCADERLRTARLLRSYRPSLQSVALFQTLGGRCAIVADVFSGPVSGIFGSADLLGKIYQAASSTFCAKSYLLSAKNHVWNRFRHLCEVHVVAGVHTKVFGWRGEHITAVVRRGLSLNASGQMNLFRKAYTPLCAIVAGFSPLAPEVCVEVVCLAWATQLGQESAPRTAVERRLAQLPERDV